MKNEPTRINLTPAEGFQAAAKTVLRIEESLQVARRRALNFPCPRNEALVKRYERNLEVARANCTQEAYIAELQNRLKANNGNLDAKQMEMARKRVTQESRHAFRAIAKAMKDAKAEGTLRLTASPEMPDFGWDEMPSKA